MNETINTKEVETLFNLGAHLGHKKNRLHPKARKFVYKMVDGVSVIDLTKTVVLIEKAQKVLEQAHQENKKLLVVATKKVISQFATEICKNNNIAFMTTKWLPGLLTNFNALIKNVKKYEEMKQEKENGAWDQFVKHERLKLSKELARLERLYGGLPHLTAKPDILLVIDIKKEKNSIIEAKAHNIPVVALVDTNSNPEEVLYPVVVNDDAPAVVEYVLTKLITSYAKGGDVKPAPAKKVEVTKTIKTDKPEESVKTKKAEDTKSKPAVKAKAKKTSSKK